SRRETGRRADRGRDPSWRGVAARQAGGAHRRGRRRLGARLGSPCMGARCRRARPLDRRRRSGARGAIPAAPLPRADDVRNGRRGRRRRCLPVRGGIEASGRDPRLPRRQGGARRSILRERRSAGARAGSVRRAQPFARGVSVDRAAAPREGDRRGRAERRGRRVPAAAQRKPERSTDGGRVSRRRRRGELLRRDRSRLRACGGRGRNGARSRERLCARHRARVQRNHSADADVARAVAARRRGRSGRAHSADRRPGTRIGRDSPRGSSPRLGRGLPPGDRDSNGGRRRHPVEPAARVGGGPARLRGYRGRQGSAGMSLFASWVERARPSAPAIADDGERRTYGELLARSLAQARALRRVHGAGRFLLIPAERSVRFVRTLLAASISGNVPVPIDAQAPERVVQEIARRCGDSVRLDLDAQTEEGEGRLPERDPALPELVIFTSGTSGTPKGVPMSAENLTHSARAITGYLDYAANPSAAVVLPLHYSYALLTQVLYMFYVGGTVRLFDNFRNPIKLARAVEAEGLLTFCGVPSTYHSLCTLHRLTPLSMPSVRVLCSAGAAMDRQLLPTVKEIFPNARFFDNYGMTEATPRISYIRDDDPRFAEPTCGTPI